MLKVIRENSLFQRFRKDEGGNMSMMFAMCAVTAVGCMGAAMDFSTLSSAHSRSQAIADHTALAAAVFVKDNGRIPNAPPPPEQGQDPEPEEGYLDKSEKIYNADELGYDYKGWVEGGAENVNVEVEYDDVKREARVKVRGHTVPTFMQIFGHRQMGFEATSTAKYQEFQNNDPASVVMVLDNSGSMKFDDKKLIQNESNGEWEKQPNTQERITALKTHANKFMQDLKAIVGNQSNDDDKVLRTGMLAYNTNTINARTVPMDWKVVPTNKINAMTANGGTNSAPPLDTARTWFSTEDETHENMHGEDPLKFLIFMTDGINGGNSTWVPEEDTGQWRGQRCWYYRHGSCRYWYWDTVEQENLPNFGRYWTEGSWQLVNNINSVADCEAMKQDGVKIYSIGFALGEGHYDTNEYFGYEHIDENTSEKREQAYSFLSSCASEPATFLTAENAEELEQAFETIGQDIQEEIIRLSN